MKTTPNTTDASASNRTVPPSAQIAPSCESDLRLILEHIPEKFFAKDQNSVYLAVNRAYAEGLGVTPQSMIGQTDFAFYPRDLAEKYRADDQRIMAEGKTVTFKERYMEQGREFVIQTTKVPVRNAAGQAAGIVGIFRDATEQAHLEEASKHAEETVLRQARELLEIATPVVQIWEGVVVATLIGTLDSQRTERATETLLERIVQTRSAVALLDVTGVPMVDTQTAQHLIETVNAVRLLGAEVIITGIRPAIAQTLVHLGIHLQSIICRPTLASGLRVAFDRLQLKVTSRSEEKP